MTPSRVNGASADVDLEGELRAILRKKVAADVEPGMTLADAGLDSLDLIEIGFDIEDKFRIQLPPFADQPANVTLADLLRLVQETLSARVAAEEAGSSRQD